MPVNEEPPESSPRRNRTITAGAHELRLRGQVVHVDGRPVSLTARQAAVLRALLDGAGKVLSRQDLLAVVWGEEPADEHTVEMTVGRLRAALGPGTRVIETVVKRGYRLAAPERSE